MEKERNLILVAEDDKEIRDNVIAAVRKCLPNFEVQDFEDCFGIGRVLTQIGERVFLVVTDMQMAMNDGGRDVAWRAEKQEVPHIILHSTSANFERRMPDKTIRVKKAPQPNDTQNLETELIKLAS